MRTVVISVLVLAVVLMIAVPALSLWLKVRGKSKNELYDVLYSLRWGETTTNNYGFAPAERNHDERFQLQLYEELYKLLPTRNGLREPTCLLEISCGRGGGLSHLVERWPTTITAVGLDFSRQAIDFCIKRYAQRPNLGFACASALDLPFRDALFDIIVNVEASHVYGDEARFFKEVYRVLRPGGVLLFTDYRKPRQAASIERLVTEIGFEGEFRDITDHVAKACTLDSDRRLRLIRAGVPWFYRIIIGHRLKTYARVEGTHKLEQFRERSRVYLMACLTKTATTPVPPV